MSIIKKNPKRRFKECNDDWERRKVGDTITDVSRPVELKDNELYQLVTVKRRNEGIVSRGKLLGKDILVKNYYEVCAGDYVISKRQLIHGANGVIPQELDKSVVSNEYMVCVSNDKITAEFLGWLSKTTGLKRDFFLSSCGVDVEKMVFNADDWKKRYLTIPSVDEQNKITSYLSNLDNLIALHQRKLDKLTCLKKAYLSEMFPAPGEKKPRRRFPGFTGYWVQRKLGDMVSFSKGTGYSKSDLQDEGTPIILYGRLYTKYETVISDVDTFAEEKPNSVFSKGREVIVPASGETAEDISVASVVEKEGVLLGGDLNIIMPPADLDSAFLALSISNGKPHNDMAKMAQGKSVVHLHNSDLAKIDLPYPSYEEQCKISSHFANIDTLITLHQRKLDKLMALKSAYLAEMFV